ncbi:MAG: ATP synthase subunit I [Burkholderiales bacterium]|nr:ATP synthase subunit I [Burkholderiales bacterium]
MRKPSDLRPMKTALLWQMGLTVAAMVVGGVFGGKHGAFSALLGGGVIVLTNASYAAMIRFVARPQTAGKTIIRLVQAEAVKIAVLLALLSLVLSFYKELQAVAFFVTFLITVLAFGAALFQRDRQKQPLKGND